VALNTITLTPINRNQNGIELNPFQVRTYNTYSLNWLRNVLVLSDSNNSLLKKNDINIRIHFYDCEIKLG
jgi:hypothetical protein